MWLAQRLLHFVTLHTLIDVTTDEVFTTDNYLTLQKKKNKTIPLRFLQVVEGNAATLQFWQIYTILLAVILRLFHSLLKF